MKVWEGGRCEHEVGVAQSRRAGCGPKWLILTTVKTIALCWDLIGWDG